jgi:hypothetical protein
MSDSTDRPSWIGYDTSSGLMRSNLIEPCPSGYYNFKFTATDAMGGSYSFYKTMLVDSAPVP